MCLEVESKATNKIKRRFKRTKTKKIKCWKVVRKNGMGLCSEYMKKTVLYGWYKSDRRKIGLTLEEQKTQSVDRGIHVYTRKIDAQWYMLGNEWSGYNIRMIPVYCSEEDLVAAGVFGGGPSAVFKKVWIKEKDYWKAAGDKNGSC